MQDAQHNLLTRDDTFLGICQGLGEDIGINPLWLRLPFVPALFFWPVETIAVYLGAGVLVLGTRLVLPAPRPRALAEEDGYAVPDEQREEKAQNDELLPDPTVAELDPVMAVAA